MQTNKIIGYTLLVMGLLLIIVPLWQTYNIFTGKASAPQIFMKQIPLKVNENVSKDDVAGQLQNALIKILPTDSINNAFNLGSWLVLMWILIYGGGKISNIGVKLIKIDNSKNGTE